ncbi:MAG: bifunctional hydroxymethylpyrimidine kinase/phosphomethylpyrimidine kinase [Ruminococcus sp.]|nr:bifunctional hydroxymethylpyrimidine kinase/phosphomethylpyrimidine kinase [Ruminococcus sp.]
MKAVLTIAGSDSSGGAGIQADIKTMTVNGVFAMSAVTALTAQNTMGVRSVMEVSPQFLAEQIDAVFEDIRPDAVKIGMVSSPELAEVIAERLIYHKAQNIVTDPVAVATSGSALSTSDAYEAVKKRLFPISAVITPNIPEASLISGMDLQSEADMEKAAVSIAGKYGCAVLCKGGHSLSDANDLLAMPDGQMKWFRGRRIDNPNTHGTGCTLSSAIATYLAKGCSLAEAVEHAKEYISGALSAMLDLGHGSGPLDHGYSCQRK